MTKIVSIDVESRQLPLRKPYELSFVTLDCFDVIVVALSLENSKNIIGEVIPLPGYAQENRHDVLEKAKSLSANIINKDLEDAREIISSEVLQTPFACSLFLCAIDYYIFQTCQLESKKNIVPLVYPVSSKDQNISANIKEAIDSGYKTIKIKLSGHLEQDVSILKILRKFDHFNIKFRFDANQAFNFKTAEHFIKAVENTVRGTTELIEQPLPNDAWDEMQKLAYSAKVPLMLDESIHIKNDITLSRKIGCKWIKLKLCKHGGAKETLALAQYAKTIGLKVVLGNGVATDISNFLELQIYKNNTELFDGACESNGFLKLNENLFFKELKFESGSAVWRL